MNEDSRRAFDERLEAVLKRMPAAVHQLLDQVPLHVEDHPPPRVLEQFGVPRHQLCGLYTGVPLSERSVTLSGNAPDVVTIYREGILNMARGRMGRVDEAELEEQIRITLLHELGHYHGFDEDDLEALGYG